MNRMVSLSPRIIEALYAEGLELSDEVRAAFDPSHRTFGEPEDLARVALSCEALRTTTRMMHCLAWLLNHRAHLRGEISAFQLQRHGRLQSDYPTSDPARLALIEPDIRELILVTERFHARLARLDAGWREAGSSQPPAIDRLRQRLAGLAG